MAHDQRQRALALCVLLFAWPATSHAQVAATDGVIEGRIQTEGGLPIGGADIQVVEQQTGYARRTQTDVDGRYRLSLLPPGEYAFVVSAAEHATATRETVVVRPGASAIVDVHLPPFTVTAAITVTAETPPADATRTVIRHSLDERVMREVPVLGRSVLELFTVQPGINARPLPTTGSGTAMPVVAFGGLSVRQINVDGVTNTLQGGARNLVISQEAIDRIDTVAHFSAEFGRVAGAIQNLVTRAGGLTPQGSAFVFTRQSAMSARPHLLGATDRPPHFSRYNAGATFGGALGRGRLRGFASYERWMQDNPVVITIDPGHARLLGIPDRDVATFTSTYRAHTATGRIDATLADDHRLVGRVNYYYNRQSPLQGGLQTRSVATRFDEHPHSITTQLVSVLGRRTLNELRVQHARRRISNGLEADPFTPNITLSGIASFNGHPDGHRVTTESGWHVIENVTIAAGRHALKAGADVLPVSFEETAANVNGTFVFGGLPAVPGVREAVSPVDQYLGTLAGAIDPATAGPFSYSRFTQTVGVSAVRSTSVHQGYFVQDDVGFGRVKIVAGLRYERFTRPKGRVNPSSPATSVIPADRNNWAPRLAAAFDVTGRGHLIVRGSAGRYFNPVIVQTYNTYRLHNGVSSAAITVTPAHPAAPAFTRNRVPPVAAGSVASDVYVFDEGFEDLEVWGWFGSVERALGRHASIELAVLGNHARHLPLSLNINLTPAGMAADGRRLWTTSPRPDPGSGNIFVAHAAGESEYRGLLATLTRRTPAGLWAQLGYHLSRTRGIGYTKDTGGFGIFTVPSDPHRPEVDRGPGDLDLRHRFTAVALHQVRAASRWWSGWAISGRAVVSSGFRLDARTGGDDNGDTQFTDRPPGIGYNAFTLPSYISLDARVSRHVRVSGRRSLEIIGEVFNITNHLNATAVNPVWGHGDRPLPTFRQPTQAEAPRQAQFGARLSF